MPAAREALRARSTPIRATRHTADPTVRRHPVPAGTCGHTDHAMAYRSPAGAGSPSGIAPGHALGTVPVGPRPSRSAVALPLDTARRTAFGIASGDGGSPRPWAENDDGRTKPVPRLGSRQCPYPRRRSSGSPGRPVGRCWSCLRRPYRSGAVFGGWSVPRLADGARGHTRHAATGGPCRNARISRSGTRSRPFRGSYPER